MKLKEQSKNILDAMKSVADNNINRAQTFISLDLEGNLLVEGKNSKIECEDGKFSFVSSDKIVSVYGRNLCILSCSKKHIHISGEIEKIELSEVL